MGLSRFQWADLQIRQVLELDLDSEIRERLGNLPKDLEAAYDEIFDRIQNMKGHKPQIAIRAFQWVMSFSESLEQDVLIAAVCQDPEDDKIQPIDPGMDMDFVLGACHNLLVVGLDGICRFSHLSVQEYFEERHWTPTQANGTVAKTCLSLLNNLGNRGQCPIPYKGIVSPYPSISRLVDYAIYFWPLHLKKADINMDNRISELVEQFLGSPHDSAPAYRWWYEKCRRTEIYGRSRNYERVKNHMRGFEDEFNPTTLSSSAVCLFGIDNVLSRWLESGSIDVNQQNQYGCSPLDLAIRGNCPETVKKLLGLGADANAQLSCGSFGSALAAAAAYSSDQDLVQLLLDSGADVNAQLSCGKYGSALAAAACSLDENIVQQLLDSGADVNAQLSCGKYGSALAAAAGRFTPNKNTVQLLLDSGADVNAQLSCGNYGSALAAAAAAAFGSDDTIVQLLLDSGADVNAQLSCGNYGSALAAAAAAAFGSDDTIVQLLLDSGADVNAQLSCGDYGSALAAARAGGVEEEWYDETTIKAIRKGKKKTIQLLLDSGANDNEGEASGKPAEDSS